MKGDENIKAKSIRIEPYIHLGVGATYYDRPASGEFSRTEVASGGYGLKLNIPLNSNNLNISFEVAEADKSVAGTNSKPVFLLNATFSFKIYDKKTYCNKDHILLFAFC